MDILVRRDPTRDLSMKIISTLITAILLATMSDACFAQGLFGQRDLGGSVSRRTQPGSAAASGTDSGARRFLRDERTVRDFVGSTAGADAATGFVGRQSAATAAISSVTGLREEARPPVNRPRTVRQAGIYAERLSLSPETQSEIQAEQKPQELSKALTTFIQSRSLTIEVSGEGRSAILRGTVPSERDRQTTELFVMLEPGIQKVENELIVDATLPPIRHRSRGPHLKSNQP